MSRQKIPSFLIEAYKKRFDGKVVRLTVCLSQAGYIYIEDVGDVEKLIEQHEIAENQYAFTIDLINLLSIINHQMRRGHKWSEQAKLKISFCARACGVHNVA